ncbi:alkaline phosphatase family protein [Halorussus salinus]|uniref:alkaline phosphatase family protein n=1 Tax=Halorussus salinus TaxID=1364935 RepID=UPI001091D3BD|nr:alkaline phosphatase family protein [Halorussus salinus]
MSAKSTDPDKAFVLGLDGVPWYLLEDWIEAGELPNFARLVEEGAAGPLESTKPPTTALAWPTIATGTWPDKHGVYAFHEVQSDYTNEMNTSHDLARPELWDVLSPAVVGNVPMTYPADDIDGQMVTGMMTPGFDGGFTSPPELADEILDEMPDYQIGLPWDEYHDDREGFLEDFETLVASQRGLLEKQMTVEDWRLFFFVFTAPDRIQHLVWDRDVLLDHYRELDDALGDVLDYVERHGANLFVVSDHGFGPIDTYVHTNTLLEREGYLTRKTGSGRGALERLGLTKERVETLLGTAGITIEDLYQRLPESVIESVASQVPGSHALYDVDFTETVAFTHGEGSLYVNDAERFEQGIVAPDQIPAVKAEVRDALEGLEDPETGQRVLNVYDGDEVFETDDDSPDLVVRGRVKEGYLNGNSLSGSVFTDSDMNATHRSEGIFLAWGPSVEAGSAPEEATVADVAPTLLHSVGEAVPEAADGRVLSEVFDPDADAARRDVVERALDERDSSAAHDADYDEVESRLKGLGYMD